MNKLIGLSVSEWLKFCNHAWNIRERRFQVYNLITYLYLLMIFFFVPYPLFCYKAFLCIWLFWFLKDHCLHHSFFFLTAFTFPEVSCVVETFLLLVINIHISSAGISAWHIYFIVCHYVLTTAASANANPKMWQVWGQHINWSVIGCKCEYRCLFGHFVSENLEINWITFVISTQQ